ncbi:hypothetical protein [Limnohabitans sp. B9-3]|uniref:hypothetical protein n=1 Tax=Limnohabitans sp. B9-3 TaxID=1100707 RepID=UPI00117A9065|nr:hypothetical protein [Limnohabitans sp. B9-3]
MKTIAVVILLSISSFSNAWDVTDARKNKEFNIAITKKILELSHYSNYDKIYDKYSIDDKQIEEGDFEPLANYTELLAFIYEKTCADKDAQFFANTIEKLGGRRSLLSVLVDYTDRNLVQCQNHRASWLDLSQKVKSRKIQNDFKSKYTELLSLHAKARNSIRADYNSNVDDVASGRPPRFTKTSRQRELAKNDVVAQVLNYASGVPEDASGMSFYYPESIENGKCIYKVAIDKGSNTGAISNQISQDLDTASKFISGVTGDSSLMGTNTVVNDGIDLSKADLKNTSFYKLQGAKRNRYTGATAYLRYQSKIEGLPDIFECDSETCNIDRLKRGWKLVESKCIGIQKAF